MATDNNGYPCTYRCLCMWVSACMCMHVYTHMYACVYTRVYQVYISQLVCNMERLWHKLGRFWADAGSIGPEPAQLWHVTYLYRSQIRDGVAGFWHDHPRAQPWVQGVVHALHPVQRPARGGFCRWHHRVLKADWRLELQEDTVL